MNAKDDIMKALWDNQNAQGIAQLLQEIVMPAISKMPADQQIEVIARFSIGEMTVEMAMKDNKQPNKKEG